MTIEYRLVHGDIFKIQENFLNKKFAFLAKQSGNSPGPRNIFHIKPSWMGHYNNVNEYIAHHVGRLVEAPVLEGAFIKINTHNMKTWSEIVNSFHNSLVFPTFLPPHDEAVFFGVRYLQNASGAGSIRELMTTVDRASNKKKFFAQFPLDQYLRNPDRHLGNHLLMKDVHRILFFLIDFDRIFNGITDWSRVVHDMQDFGCFDKPGYNADLYALIQNQTVRNVNLYAGRIAEIQDGHIDEICHNISSMYKISLPELDIISQWLKQRRDAIYGKCLENRKCYPRVTQKEFDFDYRRNTG